MSIPARGFASSSASIASGFKKSSADVHISKFGNLIAAGQLQQADQLATELLALQPALQVNPEFVVKLIQLRQRLGSSDASLPLLEACIEANPAHEGLRHGYGQLLAQQGQWPRVVQAWHGWFPLSTSFQPSMEQILAGLIKQATQAFTEHRYLDGALICCRYLAFRSDNADMWSNLGIFQTRLNNFQASENSLKRSLQLNPSRSSVWNSLGNLYSKTARHDKAIEAFKKSIEIDPDNPSPWSNIANEYHIKANLDEAYRCSAKALVLQPGAEPSFDHLTRMRRVCDFKGVESRDWLEAASTMPINAIPYSSLNILTLSETPEQHLKIRNIYARWARWVEQQAYQNPISQPITARQGRDGAPIRIGLLSADLRHHSVAKFLRPIVDHIDREKFELEAFSCYPDPADTVQQELRIKIPRFHDVERLSHRELATLIRERSIDVLMDLTGFTNHNRAGVVAYRPAPIQIGWLGYPGTTALADLDYLLLDQHLQPVNPEFMVEKPLIMQGSSVCFGSMEQVPICSELPCERNGYITFGSLNNSYKFTPLVIDLWAEVLRRVSGSRLVFFRREFESQLLRDNLVAEFSKRGVSSSRLTMINNRAEQRYFLDCYNDIDISMDTYPVVGGTTTCDALWMGVPVIGLEGSNIHQRVCSAILKNVGCPELVAATPKEFIEKSVELACDMSRLRFYRANLREVMSKSVLCDSEAFARNFQTAIASAAGLH